MTLRLLPEVTDVRRFITPEVIAQVKARQPVKAPITAPTSQQAQRMSSSDWARAYGRSMKALTDLVKAHSDTDTGRGVAGQLVRYASDLLSYGAELFAGPHPEPSSAFRTTGLEVLDLIWASMDRAMLDGLEEAEPLIRAELQETLDAAYLLVDGANAETTTERRRADAAERSLSTLKAQQQAEVAAAVAQAQQQAGQELKTMRRRAEAAERQLAEGQKELTLMRQEVARTSGRERDALEQVAALEGQLAEARSNLLGFAFRKADPKPTQIEEEFEMPKLPGEIKVKTVLDGLVLVRRLRDEDESAVFDPETRTVRSDSLGDVSLQACADDCKGMSEAEQRSYLRGFLVTRGLVAA